MDRVSDDMVNHRSNLLADVIRYIVSNFSGENLTRTKLVKLVFLADAQANEILNTKITDTTYVNYHYGPYSDEIVDTVKELDGDFLKENTGVGSRGKFYIYEPIKSYSGEELTNAEKSLINNIINEWSEQDTESMVKEVYERYNIEERPKYATIL